MQARHVRMGRVYRWGGGYWRVVGRRGGLYQIEKVSPSVGGTGAAEWLPTGDRERRPARELREL